MGSKKVRKQPVGRPPKFEEASTPVTVTLPLRTLEALQAIDQDRARAIVKCVDIAAGLSGGQGRRVETVRAFDGCGLIIIGPCPCLQRLPGLRLVEIAEARFLLVVMGGYSAHSLELDILDLMEELGPDEQEERMLLEELRRELSRYRRQDGMSSGEILLVDM